MNEREEFAAQRSVDAEHADARLLPIVLNSILAWPLPNWFEPIIDEVRRIVTETYHNEGGVGDPPIPDSFFRGIRDTMAKTRFPDLVTVHNLVPFLSTASINEGTQLAGPVGAGYEWVTMHDAKVRTAHREADGQVRTRGEKFLVGGSLMLFPGDPTAPIDL